MSEISKQKVVIKIIEKLSKLYYINRWRDVEEVFKSEGLHIRREDFYDPFKNLIICILSQNTSDRNSTIAYVGLLKKFKEINPQTLANAGVKEIRDAIKPAGLYNIKARRIKGICKILLEKYGGKVPDTREELLKLPGVGYKTADVVLCYGYGKPTIPVDTHVNVISKRLGFAEEKDNLEIVRKKLEKIVPENKRELINHLFVEFGKDICRAAKPRCKICPIKSFCKFCLGSFN